MIDRYHHPISNLFTQRMKIHWWQEITVDYTIEALPDTLYDLDFPEALRNIPDVLALEVSNREEFFHHDVVAFLSCFLDACPPAVRPYVHLGLTSSDLVEYSFHQSLHESLQDVGVLLGNLSATLIDQPMGLRLGRTHGQIAQPTTWRDRCYLWMSTAMAVESNIRNLGPRLRVIKQPGPTGGDSLRYDHADRIAQARRMAVAPSTQVISRDRTLAWASLMLRSCLLVEDIATSIWLSCQVERGEMMEGAASNRHGSSSMPHKQNPIGCEQLRGMARLARGCFMTISENYALFDDRDISNSCVERVAVPDLASITGYMIETMSDILRNLVVHEEIMALNLGAEWGPATSSRVQAALQMTCDMDFLQASEVTRTAMKVLGKHPAVATRDEVFDIIDGDHAQAFADKYRELTAHWQRQLVGVLKDEDAPA